MFRQWITTLISGQQLNAAFAQGDVVAWPFTGTVQTAPPTPLNLTGAVIKFALGLPNILNLSSASSTSTLGITITDAANGKFQININSTTTAGLPAGEYPYDIFIESQVSPPTEGQYIRGTIYVDQAVNPVP